VALLQSVPPPAEIVPQTGEILGRITGVFSTTLGAVVNLAIVLVMGFYLALDPGQYARGVTALITPRYRERGREVLAALARALRWWLVGRVAAMAVVGVLTAIGLALAGMPLVLALALIAGLLSFIPFAGPILSAIPAVLIGLVESPLTALYVVVIYAGVQFIEGNFATPLIQKRAVSLPPAVLITAQLLFGVLFGFFGVLLATPITVAGIVVVQILYIQGVLGAEVTVLGQHRSPAPVGGEEG
jgi:predicted PurR-regulated permease PerM